VQTLALLRDIAVIIIALELFVMLLVPAVILYFIVKGTYWVERQMKHLAPVAQLRFRQLAEATEKASHKAAAPVMTAEENAARVRRIRQVI
jgi:hypothetical protein